MFWIGLFDAVAVVAAVNLLLTFVIYLKLARLTKMADFSRLNTAISANTSLAQQAAGKIASTGPDPQPSIDAAAAQIEANNTVLTQALNPTPPAA